MPEAVIVSAARSPIGRANKGSLKDFRPDDLTALVVQAALDKIPGLEPAAIEDLLLGCGLPGGESGNNMARVVTTLLGLEVPDEVRGRTFAFVGSMIRLALALVLAALAVAVPLTMARRQEPTPRGTPVNVRLEDFKVRRDAAVVRAGTVSFLIRNQGPTTHEIIVVRTDLAPDKLPLQSDGLTVDEEGDGVEFLDEAQGLDIDDRQTMVLDLAAGNYVLYCNLEGHYLGGMHAALTVR